MISGREYTYSGVSIIFKIIKGFPKWAFAVYALYFALYGGTVDQLIYNVVSNFQIRKRVEEPGNDHEF